MDVKLSCGKGPNTFVSPITSDNIRYGLECYYKLLLSIIMSSVQSSTNSLLILLITREIIKKKQKIFRNHLEIRGFTDVFKWYQKESFAKTVINSLNIDCTGDKFTHTKRRSEAISFW